MKETTKCEACAVCVNAYDSLNGRFCHNLNRYVTHETEPPCES